MQTRITGSLPELAPREQVSDEMTDAFARFAKTPSKQREESKTVERFDEEDVQENQSGVKNLSIQPPLALSILLEECCNQLVSLDATESNLAEE